ncbi:MAG: MFS transporter, partial [Anaerolineales bacterium]|nr:MFS transporter [Anaerolineales bacterium]
VGWRGVFVSGALLTVVVAAAIVVFTRSTPPGAAPAAPSGPPFAGYRAVFQDARFWRIAPLTFFSNGTLLAVQGLWAGPYLYDLYGVDQAAAGRLLLLLSLGVTFGFGASGWLAARLGLARVVAAGVAAFSLCQGVLALGPGLSAVAVTVFLFGLSGGLTIMLLVQPRQLVPAELMGRATTATNLFSISGIFLLQWLMGLIIGRFAPDGAGHYPLAAYRLALSLTAAGNLLALAWYWPLVRPSRRAAP